MAKNDLISVTGKSPNSSLLNHNACTTTVFRRLAKRISPVGPEASPRKSIRRRRKAVGGRVGAHPEVSRGRPTHGAQTQRERYARPKKEPPGESPPRQLWRQSIQTSPTQGKWAGHLFIVIKRLILTYKENLLVTSKNF